MMNEARRHYVDPKREPDHANPAENPKDTPQKSEPKTPKKMRNPDDLISMIRNSVFQFRIMRRRSEAGSMDRAGSGIEDGDSGEPDDKGESGKSSSEERDDARGYSGGGDGDDGGSW
jgi:hypothetical protein